jgi:uncharacterized sulfatase
MKPNIVWLTLDSVRADHTTMAGYDRDTTPNLQRIADLPGGQYFSNCFASGIGTPTSSASILSGTYPSRHGLSTTNGTLPADLDTLPELLAEQGYATAGLSRNSYVSSGTGLDRGFDRFEWISGSTFFQSVPPAVIARYLLNVRSHSAGLTTDTARHATPFVMNKMLERWLKDLRTTRPFFLYAHYNEPHRPYYPPLPYLDQYTEELSMTAEQAVERSMEIHESVNEIIADGYTLSEADEAALIAMYDAEIAYTDSMIGRLFDYVQSLELGETVFVVTADHGELFGEHGLLAHRLVLDDAVTHVPLVVHGLDDLAVPPDDLVQHLDVVRTLLELAGGRTEQMQGVNLFGEGREYAISQRGPSDFSTYRQHNRDFDTSRFHGSTLTGFRTDTFRYQRSDDRRELFELPDESTDVAADYPDVVERFDADLSEWLSTDGQPVSSGTEDELTESMRRQLRDLGYVE